MTAFEIVDKTLHLRGELTRLTVASLFDKLSKVKSNELTTLDLSGVELIDSSGVALINSITHNYEGISVEKIPQKISDTLDVFSYQPDASAYDVKKINYFEQLGDKFYTMKEDFTDLMFLASDIVFWSFHDIFYRKGQRKGSFVQQSILLGLDAVGIIALLSLILGFIMALQSGNQLRQFGASVFLADMLSVTMVNELAPILTAIIIAGRSGSSI
ncbi:MAG: ABC transporter permease, partial [Candidatus Zophobacter franzmannii]|nr:ABC transporter permease [Candidatus Zophobacter franzmannii]